MSLTDYSGMEKEISGAPEPKILMRGEEVKARVIKVNSGVSEKNDCSWYSIVFDVPSDPMVKEFSDFFWDLTQRDKLDPKSVQRSLYQFRSFATAFGVDYSRPFSWEDDLIGKEGWIIVGIRKTNDYGDQNTVSKYVTGPGKDKTAPAIDTDDPY